ncbi:hypothetical protein Gotur_016726 [Gossypium turneri]
MARLPLIAQSVTLKRIGIALTIWLQICRIASLFLLTLGASHSLHTYRPRIRSYILDFYAKWDYVKRLIYASDETYNEQVRMNRIVFFKLCDMLQTLGGLKSSRNMLVDEQSQLRLILQTQNGNGLRYWSDIATNMLGVCTPDMQFVYVLPGWEGC